MSDLCSHLCRSPGREKFQELYRRGEDQCVMKFEQIKKNVQQVGHHFLRNEQ